MKHVEANQTEQRSEKTTWTEREKELAEKFEVEPKLIRLLDKITQYQIGLCIGKAGGEAAVAASGEVTETAESKEQPTEETGTDLCQSEKMLKKWLLERDYKAKLASLLLSTLRFDDHGTNKLANEIYNKYEDEILATAANPPENLPSDELLMTGIVVEQSIWYEHY